MLKLSRETRQDPSKTGKLRKEFADSLIRVFKYHAADIGEQSSRLSTTVDKYLRQGYLAGQIYSAVVLKLYKPPFKPMVDEDSLLNIIADAQITSQIPNTLGTMISNLPNNYLCSVVNLQRQDTLIYALAAWFFHPNSS